MDSRTHAQGVPMTNLSSGRMAAGLLNSGAQGVPMPTQSAPSVGFGGAKTFKDLRISFSTWSQIKNGQGRISKTFHGSSTSSFWIWWSKGKSRRGILLDGVLSTATLNISSRCARVGSNGKCDWKSSENLNLTPSMMMNSLTMMSSRLQCSNKLGWVWTARREPVPRWISNWM